MLQLENASLERSGRKIFNHFNWNIEPGRIYVLFGPSGIGKTSLLRVLAGLLPLSEGRLIHPSLQTVSMVFQDAQLLPWLSVQENILFLAGLRNVQVDPRKVDSLLQKLNIFETKNLYPYQLSGGMKMRASLARAFAQDPRLLLLDEPFSALDEPTREELQILVRQKADQDPKLITVLVTHSVREALFMGDEILLFRGKNLETLTLEKRSLHSRDQNYLDSSEFQQFCKEWKPRLLSEKQV